MLVRNRVLLLNWSAVTDDDPTFVEILAAQYRDLELATVTTRKLQSLITSKMSLSRKNISKAPKDICRVEIHYRHAQQWLSLDGVMHSLDEEPAENEDQLFHALVKERKTNGGLVSSFVIDSQTAENLPIFKALFIEDQKIPVTVPRKRWPDYSSFGFSTSARKGEPRPPGNKITVQRGQIMLDATTGDRYRMWTQVVRSSSIILPPRFAFRETLPALPSVPAETTVPSQPL